MTPFIKAAKGFAHSARCRVHLNSPDETKAPAKERTANLPGSQRGRTQAGGRPVFVVLGRLWPLRTGTVRGPVEWPRCARIRGWKTTRALALASILLLSLSARSLADQFDTLRLYWQNYLISNGVSPSSIASAANGY